MIRVTIDDLSTGEHEVMDGNFAAACSVLGDEVECVSAGRADACHCSLAMCHLIADVSGRPGEEDGR